MKFILQLVLTALIFGLAISFAQDGGPPPGGPGGGGPGGQGGPRGQSGPGGEGHHRPPPIITALDLNHDGTIDADEIAKAPKSLLTLDKNGDGKLTPDELHPPPPLGQNPGQGQMPQRSPGGHP